MPPVKILERGRIVRDVMSLILANVRTPREREGDLTAQIAACRIGERRLMGLVTKYGSGEVTAYGRHLLDYSAKMMAATLDAIPDGVYRAADFLDDDGVTAEPQRIAVTIRIRGQSAEVDFTGSAPQCAGSVNAVEAITQSAVFYVFRCLLDEQVPATSGLMRSIRVIAPAGTIVNARPPAAVAGGNVETSQRIVDTLLRALARAIPSRIPAASQGTMNNLTFGGSDCAARRCAVRLLRDDCRRNWRRPRMRGIERHASPHDQYAQYAHGSPRTRLSGPRASLRPAKRFRRPWKIQRRRRNRSRNRNARRCSSRNALRPKETAALWFVRRHTRHGGKKCNRNQGPGSDPPFKMHILCSSRGDPPNRDTGRRRVGQGAKKIEERSRK